jgi:hypothetical protein
MEPEGSLNCSQEPATGPYWSTRFILVLSFNLLLGF